MGRFTNPLVAQLAGSCARCRISLYRFYVNRVCVLPGHLTPRAARCCGIVHQQSVKVYIFTCTTGIFTVDPKLLFLYGSIALLSYVVY